MRIAIVIFGYLLAAYFFAAANLPHIRLRWGYARSWIRSRSGKTEVRYRQPKMGTLSCLGIGITIAAFSTVFVGLKNDTAMTIAFSFLVVGFIFGIIGQLLDTGGRGSGRWKKY